MAIDKWESEGVAQEISRREFLTLSGLLAVSAAVGVSVAACVGVPKKEEPAMSMNPCPASGCENDFRHVKSELVDADSDLRGMNVMELLEEKFKLEVQISNLDRTQREAVFANPNLKADIIKTFDQKRSGYLRRIERVKAFVLQLEEESLLGAED
ncbi:twin-arginine translocation signal domain-containing protein [Patescibacteria group bacterium]|nr:twin-arginine translocation signal domain-containing protein [Patescibacteria group bacterium]